LLDLDKDSATEWSG